MKKWLRFHYPAILGVPPIQNVKTTAMLSDSMLCEKHLRPSHPRDHPSRFMKRRDIPTEIVSILKSAAIMISPHQLKKVARKLATARQLEDMEAKLKSLQVQNKFGDIIELEESTHIWRRIIDGMPAGQLLFILRCGSDTLPSPMNLPHWKIQLHSHCPLCKSPQATVNHILNGCPTALEDSRYSWRHHFILLKLNKLPEKPCPLKLPSVLRSNRSSSHRFSTRYCSTLNYKHNSQTEHYCFTSQLCKIPGTRILWE